MSQLVKHCSLIINLRYLTWYYPTCLIFSPKLIENSLYSTARSIQLTSHNMVNDMDDAIAGVDVSVQYLRYAYWP